MDVYNFKNEAYYRFVIFIQILKFIQDKQPTLQMDQTNYQITLKTIYNEQKQQPSSRKHQIVVPEVHALIYERQRKKIRQIYLIPAFTRLVISRINSIDMYSNEGIIGARLYLTLRYGGIPDKYVNNMLRNIVLILNDSQHLSFCMNQERQFQSYQNHGEKTATFIKTMKIPGTLDAKIFLAPFERLHLSISISILPYFMEQLDQQTGQISIVGFRFNHMMNKDIQKMFNISRKHNCLTNGEYALAHSKEYLNISITDSQGNQQISSTYQEDVMDSPDSDRSSQTSKQNYVKFRQANLINFQCMLYRLPSVAITTIFIPLWVMGFITICIYTMSPDIDARLTFAATIYVSFAAYFQVIRSALPKSPHISMMEIIVYAIIAICVLGVSRTLTLKLYIVQLWQDSLFIISLILLVGSMLLILGGFIVHKLYMEKLYLEYDEEKCVKISAKIRINEWENSQVRQALYDFKYDLIFAESKKAITSPNLNLAEVSDLKKNPASKKGDHPLTI